MCSYMLQVIGPTMGDAYLRMKLKDQQASLHMVDTDPDLVGLRKVSHHLLVLTTRTLRGYDRIAGQNWHWPCRVSGRPQTQMCQCEGILEFWIGSAYQIVQIVLCKPAGIQVNLARWYTSSKLT